MRAHVNGCHAVSRGLQTMGVLAAMCMMGCVTTDVPPVQTDSGTQAPVGTCVPVAVECASLDEASCRAAVGCEIDGACSGQHDSCLGLENSECSSQQGCEIWMGYFCDNINDERPCTNFNPNTCASIGCTLTVTGCNSIPYRCGQIPLAQCGAAVGCELSCPADQTACGGACRPAADAASDPRCNTDCLGVTNGTAQEDACGVCDSDSTNDCVVDCAGVPAGEATVDECGVCDTDASNDCVRDCNGVYGGPSAEDACGICDDTASNDCAQDCNGVWGGYGALNGGVCSASAPGWCSAAGGVWEYDHCWFLGQLGSSCSATCANAGLAYDEATRYVAGSGGKTSRCAHALEVLGHPLLTRATMGYSPDETAAGCVAHDGVGAGFTYGFLYYNGITSAAAAVADDARVCACE